MTRRQEGVVTFSVRMDKRTIMALEALRPAFGDAPRSSLIRIACERLLTQCAEAA